MIRNLPETADPPVVQKQDPDSMPIMLFSISAPMPDVELTTYIEQNVQKRHRVGQRRRRGVPLRRAPPRDPGQGRSRSPERLRRCRPPTSPRRCARRTSSCRAAASSRARAISRCARVGRLRRARRLRGPGRRHPRQHPDPHPRHRRRSRTPARTRRSVSMLNGKPAVSVADPQAERREHGRAGRRHPRRGMDEIQQDAAARPSRCG